MNMKKNTVLILLLLLLVGLAAAYRFLTNRSGSGKGTADSGSSIDLTLADFDAENLRGIKLTSNSSELLLEKKGEEWTANTSRAVKLDQDEINSLARSFSWLSAEKMVDDNPADLARYGLETPAASAEVLLADGTGKVFYLGDKAIGGSYYLMVKGDPKVYTIWSGTAEKFLTTLDDLRDRSLPAIDPQKLAYFRLVKKGGRIIEIKRNENPREEQALYGMGGWLMTKPYAEPLSVNGEKFNEILSEISGLSIDEFIDDNPKSLASYGLADPRWELLVKDEEKTLHLYFGQDCDEESIYFKTGEAKAVYAIAKSRVKFLETTPFALTDKFICIPFIDDVDKIIIEDGKERHLLTLTRETVNPENEETRKQEKAENVKEETKEEAEIITTYKVDGREVAEKPFKTFYQSLIGLMAVGENDKKLKEDPEVKTTFFLNKGSRREILVSYVPYDRDLYAVFKDGRSEFLIPREDVERMLAELGRLIRGELKEE